MANYSLASFFLSRIDPNGTVMKDPSEIQHEKKKIEGAYHPKGYGLQDPKNQSKDDAWRPWLRRVSWPRIKEIWTQDRSHPHLILALVLLEVPEDKEENCSLVTLQTWKCRASCPLREFLAPEKN